ncbi:MAG: ornithine--oxo-acid transaminase [Acidobacteriota bacterium]
MTSAFTMGFIDEAEQYGAHNYHPLAVVLDRGEGIWVWDVDGNKYLDCLTAYSALNQGHRHPRIVEALKAQADRITLTSRAFHNDQMGPLVHLLCNITGYQKALLMNTGAEAVETAIKTARKWGYKIKGAEDDKAEIIVCANNFHGRTTTIVGFSTEAQYRDGFGPFTPGFKVVPYGDADALKRAVTPNTVGFLVEPIQGEGGVVVPPEEYLKEAYAVCRENRVLFIADEIQTGFCRTGRWFACDYAGIKPDIMILGKALGGGCYPVSAIVADDEIMEVFHPGDHGSTFGGNPLGAAVARASLEVLRDEKLDKRAAESGAYFMERLRDLKSPHIEEIRGKGLLVGVVIRAASGKARPFCEKLMNLGILAKETHESVIRFAPALIIAKEEIDWAMDRIAEALA